MSGQTARRAHQVNIMTAQHSRRSIRCPAGRGRGFELAVLALLGALCALRSLPVAAADAAGTHPRVALVIGNANYTAVKPLGNPANDAQDMCEALGKLTYKTSCYTDVADRREFRARIQDFVDSVPAKADVLFYYAGHAVQLKGENYLVPTSARLRSEADIPRETISLNYLMTQLSQAKHHLNIVVLDACRNNPWPETMHAAASGLAPITAIPRGSVVLYATAANDVSGDGEGRNGTLTKNLLANISVPGLTIDDVFKRVSEGVQADSVAAVGHAQTPALYTNFTGEFCFAGCIDKVARAELEKMQKANQEQLEQAQREKAEMAAKLAATETSMNCDKSVLSDSGQCFTALPDATLRAATEALLQSGFTIGQVDAQGGIVQGVRKLANPTDKNATDTVTATIAVRAIPVTGHSVATISADQQTTELQSSRHWSQVVLIPIPGQKQYTNVVKKDTRVTDPQFYSTLFTAIERNLRSEAPVAATAPRAGVAPDTAGIPRASEQTPAEVHSPATELPAQLASSHNQHHVGVPPQHALCATIGALVKAGYIVDSVDHSLGLVTATHRVLDLKDTRYSNNVVASAYVAAEQGGNGARVQLSANEQRVLHRKSSKMFGKPSYEAAVVERDGSVTDDGYYRDLFAAIEANLVASESTLSAHAHRFGAPIERTLPAAIDGLAQRGFSIDQADNAVGFVTAHRARDDKATGETVLESATVYVKADSGEQSTVIVSASERAVGYVSAQRVLSAMFGGLLGADAGRGNRALTGIPGQEVVTREGEISDAAFYGGLFSTIDEKLRK
jgi:hypothetical protein